MSGGYRKFLNLYAAIVFVGIGGLQMYRVNAGWLTNYGADLLAPPYLYLASRGGIENAGAGQMLRGERKAALSRALISTSYSWRRSVMPLKAPLMGQCAPQYQFAAG